MPCNHEESTRQKFANPPEDQSASDSAAIVPVPQDMNANYKLLVPLIKWTARLALAMAVAGGSWWALSPNPPPLPGDPADYYVHFAAFAGFTLIARIAFYQSTQTAIFIALALLGGGIEIAQAYPLFRREPSVIDWLANVFAIAAMLLLTRGIRFVWQQAFLKSKFAGRP